MFALPEVSVEGGWSSLSTGGSGHRQSPPPRRCGHAYATHRQFGGFVRGVILQTFIDGRSELRRGFPAWAEPTR